MARRLRPPAKKPVTASKPIEAAELLGLSREELAALGEDRFETLLSEAFQRELERRMRGFNAAMETAKALIPQGQIDTALGLLQSAANALGQDALSHRDISRRFARMIFGSRSERLEREQLGLLFKGMDGDPAVFEAAQDKGVVPDVPVPPPPTEPASDVADDAAETPSDDEAKPEKKKRPNHHGRTKLEVTCTKIETTTLVPEGERDCHQCGNELSWARFIVNQRLEWIPARLELHEEKREVLACKACKGDAATAPRLGGSTPWRRIANSVVANLIVEKCSEAQPLHRERLRYARLGWPAAPSTLDTVWRWGTTLLVKVADIFRGEVLASEYIQADSTPLTILDPKHPKHRFKGQMWCFVGGGQVAFDFAKDWSAPAIADSFLVNAYGFKQVDGYAGYASAIEHEKKKVLLVQPDKRLGCGMHVRRPFYEALTAGEARAARPLDLIQGLYRIEREANDGGMTHADRHELRQKKSLPIVAELRAWLDLHVDKHPPKSPLGRAVAYADGQWEFFARCFSRGDFEIDNGECERQIRILALGRKNFLFSGSVDAADRLCAAYTLVVGAKRNGLDPFAYIRDLLTRLEHGFPTDRLSELTPTKWRRQ